MQRVLFKKRTEGREGSLHAAHFLIEIIHQQGGLGRFGTLVSKAASGTVEGVLLGVHGVPVQKVPQ